MAAFMSEPNITTRRHPRTLAEAFPSERWACIERPPVSRFDRIAGVALAVFIGISGAVLLVHWAAR